MKKAFYTVLALCSSGASAVFAQEQQNPIDLAKAETAVANMKDAFTGLVNNHVIVAAVAVVGVLVGLWVIPKIPRWIGMGRK